MNTFLETVAFVVVTCYKCGVQFGMPGDVQAKRHGDGETFYCINGHPQFYTESREKKLEKLLATANRTANFWHSRNEVTQLSLRATKGQVTKLKKKIASGSCPSCDKHFKDLQKHMDKVHPDFVGKPDRDDKNN